MKMENDIVKDVQVILAAQGEEIEKISEVLDGEQTYAEIQVLKNIAEEAGVSLTQTTTLKYGDDIDFITDKTHLLQKVMTEGAPDIYKIEEEFKRVLNKPISLHYTKQGYTQNGLVDAHALKKDWYLSNWSRSHLK